MFETYHVRLEISGATRRAEEPGGVSIGRSGSHVRVNRSASASYCATVLRTLRDKKRITEKLNESTFCKEQNTVAQCNKGQLIQFAGVKNDRGKENRNACFRKKAKEGRA